MSHPFIDFHTHILPGLDHGSKSIEETKAQISLFLKHDVREVICTSHFYGHVHRIDDFLERREKSSLVLENYIKENKLDFRFHLSAETLAFVGIENLDRLSELTIGNSSTLLIELPYGPLASNIENSIAKLKKNGYDILLAHADRYNETDIERLISLGAKVQLNASALSSLFVKRSYIRWLRDGVCVALGSDIHSDDEKAIQKFLKASKRIEKYKQNFADYANMLLQ